MKGWAGIQRTSCYGNLQFFSRLLAQGGGDYSEVSLASSDQGWVAAHFGSARHHPASQGRTSLPVLIRIWSGIPNSQFPLRPSISGLRRVWEMGQREWFPFIYWLAFISTFLSKSRVRRSNHYCPRWSFRCQWMMLGSLVSIQWTSGSCCSPASRPTRAYSSRWMGSSLWKSVHQALLVSTVPWHPRIWFLHYPDFSLHF